MKKLIILLSFFSVSTVYANCNSLDTYVQREICKGNCNAGSTYESRQVCKGNTSAVKSYALRKAAEGNCSSIDSYSSRQACNSCSSKTTWVALYLEGAVVSCK